MPKRTPFAGLVATGWVVVSLLPWWQLRVEHADLSGQRTEIVSADVWRTSTWTSAAVVVAGVVTVALVLAGGRPPRQPTAEQRAAVLVGAWTPVAILAWVAWSIFRDTTAPHVYTVLVTAGPAEFSDFGVTRDHLAIRSLPGLIEGPGWGLFIGVPLVVAIAIWATVHALCAPDDHGAQ